MIDPLPAATKKYFEVCEEKLGLVPNVLRAYAFDFVKVTEASHRVEEADRDDLRTAGFSKRDIWEVAPVAGFFYMANRLASATNVSPNQEYHARAR